ncbi:DUF4255 domain-containing protein [Heliobacterium gestii]|uniref:DUF4255 domain-containing protein n=1 Tax=Heliomicrobium gestii TaxID=2699 RepID=A0A845LBX9_HELGE|nr:DUF4255 domain-containing protein [Heliomicrobium gestii]MBM7868051.1 hypothetical protein [Heliomicrobium gestii]MZP44317.1 DUF4255 domain-containing protein [Heliomicrobium gestii]
MALIGNYTVFADTANTLLKLLRENLTPDPIPKPEMIGFCSPYEKGDFRLALFLYEVKEARESYMPSVGMRLQPLKVYLRFMLTAFSTVDLMNRAIDEATILGKAMQVMHQQSLLKSSALTGTLAENGEELHITLDPLSFEEIAKLWSFADVTFKPSVSYTVGPIYLDTAQSGDTARVM